jgi:hypothetical protein
MLGNPDEHFIKEWELLHQLSLEEQWELSKVAFTITSLEFPIVTALQDFGGT